MYPVAYRADYIERQSRLSALFRVVLAIPWLLVALFWGLAGFVGVVAAWFILLGSGRYPRGLYDFVAQALRYFTRVNGFMYFVTDRFPPLDGSEHPEYPVRLDVAPPRPEYSRLKVLLRIFLAIPVLILAYLMSLLIGIVWYLSWIVVVITGKHPKGLLDVVNLGLGYMARASAYMALLTETYPPVSDNGDGEGHDGRGPVAYEPPVPAPAPAAATDGPTVSGGPTAPEHDPFGGSGSPFGR